MAAVSPEVHSAVAELPGLGQTILSLIVVLAVIFVLAAMLKRLQSVRAGGAGDLRIRAGLQVGPKERVLLIEAAGAHLLIGVSPSGIRTLHTYDQAPLPAELENRATPIGDAFASVLKRSFGQGRDA